MSVEIINNNNKYIEKVKDIESLILAGASILILLLIN